MSESCSTSALVLPILQSEASLPKLYITMENTCPDGDAPAMRWYCLRCQPRMERLASESLRRLPGVEVFYPRTVHVHKSQSGDKPIRKPLFPSYLFTSFDPKASMRAVNYAQGVSYIVRHGIEPVEVPASIIQELEYITEDGVLSMPSRRPVPGQSVRILHGLFNGGEATVSKLIPEKKRIEVLLEILGSPCLVDVDEGLVDAGNSHPLQNASVPG